MLNHDSARKVCSIEAHDLAVDQPGGACTFSDPADGPLGPGVRVGGRKGLTAT